MLPRNLARLAASVVVGAVVAASCSSSDSEAAPEGTSDLSADERCGANKAVGTITYLSGFDFAASAGIVDVIVADELGYFDELCLDVELIPSGAPANLALLAAGEAQFANTGSFGDLMTANVNGEADLVAIEHYGKVGIQALVVSEASGIETLSQVAGSTMGIKSDLPPDVEAMLTLAGVERGSFDEILLDTFNPFDAFDLGIQALPVYKSNEPLQLDAAGFSYTLFDPADNDIPASFGILATTSSFLDQHPTVVEDFLRASFKGYEYAAANQEAAVDFAIERINAAGNSYFLFKDSELPRWQVEAELIAENTPDGEGAGIPDTERLGAEAEILTTIGRFDELPDWESMVVADIAEGLYDGPTLIWPGGE